ncbi:hypothetical protein LCGC14_0567640 [marine sediment metagenome]|uniref:Uncharacterized protein n=1 Tax=marine sediment metagenome TaxID=412755 RepID=A0A0F9U6J5_9ZZZZ
MKHYHYSSTHHPEVDQHPGGHLRHQHPSRNLWGYGRTRKSLKAL